MGKILKWLKTDLYKNIVIILLIIFAGFLLWKTMSYKPIDYSRYEFRVDSIQQVNKKLNLQVDLFRKKTDKLNLDQEQYEQIADSLHKLLAIKKLPCPKVVVIQDKEITNLRGALKRCNKVKAIQVKTIGIYSKVIVNHEQIAIETHNLQKVSKKAIRKAKLHSFLTGVGVGAAIITLIVLL